MKMFKKAVTFGFLVLGLIAQTTTSHAQGNISNSIEEAAATVGRAYFQSCVRQQTTEAFNAGALDCAESVLGRYTPTSVCAQTAHSQCNQRYNGPGDMLDIRATYCVRGVDRQAASMQSNIDEAQDAYLNGYVSSGCSI